MIEHLKKKEIEDKLLTESCFESLKPDRGKNHSGVLGKDLEKDSLEISKDDNNNVDPLILFERAIEEEDKEGKYSKRTFDAKESDFLLDR